MNYIYLMNELTKAEEQVMQYMWKLEKAFLKDIVEQFPEPRPAYTTISTVVRVLVKKGFLKYESFGKIRQYAPVFSKERYFKGQLNTVVTNFFNGSKVKFVNFFTENEDLDLNQLEEIKSLLEQKIDKLKKDGQ